MNFMNKKLLQRMRLNQLSFMQGGIDKYYKLWFGGSKPVFY